MTTSSLRRNLSHAFNSHYHPVALPKSSKNVLLYCVATWKAHLLTTHGMGKVKLWVKLHALPLWRELISEPPKGDGIFSPAPALPSFLLTWPCAAKPLGSPRSLTSPISSSGQKGELGTGRWEGCEEEGRPLLLLAERCCNSLVTTRSFGCWETYKHIGQCTK